MVVWYALDDQLVEGPAHPGDGLRAGRRVDDQLADQRVVVGRDAVADLDVRVPADAAGRRGRAGAVIRPGEGRKSLSGSSALIRHSKAWPRVAMSSWRERQRLAGGDADLLLDQVDAGDQLGDRVLDLDAGVDLDEVEVVVGVDQELAGAGVDVAGGLGQPDGGLAELRADLERQGRGGRLLDELLVPALERAVAVPAVDDVAVRSARIWTSTCRGRSMNFSR